MASNILARLPADLPLDPPDSYWQAAEEYDEPSEEQLPLVTLPNFNDNALDIED